MNVGIKTKGGERLIEAEVYGLFAVHGSTGKGNGRWTITHTPTGLAIAGSSRKASARRCARWLAEVATDGAWLETSKDALFDALDLEERARVKAHINGYEEVWSR